jgi:predicted RND superfamily exporter protein
METGLKILNGFADGIVRHRKAVILLFCLAALICAPLAMTVKINYDLADYLPEDARSTHAVQILSEEFVQPIPNTQVLLYDVSIPEVLAYKELLAQVEGVTEVSWLDDMADIHQPLITQNSALVEDYYKDGNALVRLNIAEASVKDTIPAVREVVGSAGAVAGDAASSQAMQQAASSEVLGAFAILLPAVLLILILTTTSWLEPLLFLAAIGFAIILNMGTNVVFNDISFMTNSVSPILQMAVSLDYTIFLMHAFARQRKVQPNAELAMKAAIGESFTSIAASASTTLFGFLALLAMQFLIGADLGINLAKGIVFSFISVVVLLPALTLVCLKALDKTAHRPFTSSFAGASRFFIRLSPVVAVVTVLVVAPAFLGQQQTEFLYGKESIAENTSVGVATREIEEIFGKTVTLVELVPRGEAGREAELAERLKALPHVSSVASYATTVGTGIPPEFLSENIRNQFYSAQYARMVLGTNAGTEGKDAFDTVEAIQDISAEFYGEAAYTAGMPATLLDMKETVSSDTLRVNLMAVAAIFLVLLVTFRSLLLPIILVLSIESAIWINLAIPYFFDLPINFIGYLVLSSVQLGATVDYAILLTSTYMRLRRQMPARAAISQALSVSFKSILVSATTLAICGFALTITTTNPAVADIGTLLCRGTILSAFMVLCFLPALLIVFDRLVAKTTYRANFYYAQKFNAVRGKT